MISLEDGTIGFDGEWKVNLPLNKGEWSVAVDGGAGWGEREGRAIVEAKPIFYHSRPFIEPPLPPDPLG